jgi:hypothetical protein
MINKTLLLSIVLISFINCTDFQIKELKLNELYNESTKGTVMNLYSANIDPSLNLNSDLVIDAKLDNRAGILNTPLVFVSTVKIYLF